MWSERKLFERLPHGLVAVATLERIGFFVDST